MAELASPESWCTGNGTVGSNPPPPPPGGGLAILSVPFPSGSASSISRRCSAGASRSNNTGDLKTVGSHLTARRVRRNAHSKEVPSWNRVLGKH